MLAVEVLLLTDRYTATRHNDRNQPEWPPHPHRLFSALVATWADADRPDALERGALEWFQALGAPQIACSEATSRSAVITYVPVNDASVVRDLSRLYERHQAASSKLSDAHSDGDTAVIARAERELDKVVRKIGVDSKKAAAAKPKESPGAVKTGLQVLPDQRGRQGRSYPTVFPEDSTVCFIWPDAIGEAELIDRLDGLLARVHRLGHSSTLVACRVTDKPPEASLLPDPDGPQTMRVTGPGLLAELDRAFAQHEGNKPRTLPAFHTAYGPRRAEIAIPASVLSGDWIVLEHVAGPMPPVRRTVEVARNVRKSLLKHAPEPVPELVSGHVGGSTDKGLTSPSQRKHLAVLPLGFVGRPHADGAIYGVALALPTGTSREDLVAVLAALDAWSQAGGDDSMPVYLGRAGIMKLRLRTGPVDRAILGRSYWCRPCKTWTTATPIALDRHPGDLRNRNSNRRAKAELEAEQSIRKACENIGLPQPVTVAIDLDSFVVGTPRTSVFPPFTATSGPRRALTHARLRFASPVRGPVVLGAGRYRGLGLCLPTPDAQETMP